MSGEQGFGALARALAGFLDRLEGDGGPLLRLSAALLVSAVRRGHTCLDLVDAGGRTLGEVVAEDCPPGREAELLPSAATWRTGLSGLRVVGSPGAYAPLVLDPGGRLYLHRYWTHEKAVAGAILDRLVPGEEEQVPAEVLASALDRLFPGSRDRPDWQRAAAAVAAMGRFAVISGGPGTGKTYTLVRVLALVAEMEALGGRRARMALAAPTGKAASRLAEALRAARESLPSTSRDVLPLIPTEASTIHRLLGYGRPERRLPLDLVVVDESSMADVSLMASLVRALPPRARVVLAGDRDQLSSVEAGVVLGDICDTGAAHGWTPAAADRIRGVCPGLGEVPADPGEPPIAGSIVVLRRNYRMAEGGELDRLAQATNRGDAEEVLTRLGSGSVATLKTWRDEGELGAHLAEAVVPWFRGCLRASTPEELFQAHARQVVLCATRKGPAGVEEVNTAIVGALRHAGLVSRRSGPDRRWFPGLPVIITVNDYAVRLFNGDIGIAPTPILAPATGAGRVCLVSRPEGGWRAISTARLPAHEPAFALTVHKSQGSEFDRVLLVLPRTVSPVLCRELFYTALTRARTGVTVLGTPEIVRHMVERRTRRRSGLRDLLWATGTG